MGLISRLMGEETQVGNRSKSIKALAPEQGAIHYDANLVETLKAEHQELVEAFSIIRKTSLDGRFGHLPELLEQFRLALLNHIALENVKFYVYMQNHVEVDAETHGFIAAVRKDMNTIARAVTKFVDTHLDNTPSYATQESFLQELDEIGNVLAGRIAFEENQLYALYRP